MSAVALLPSFEHSKKGQRLKNSTVNAGSECFNSKRGKELCVDNCRPEKQSLHSSAGKKVLQLLKCVRKREPLESPLTRSYG